VRLLQMLLRHPARSRAELGRTLGLSRATVTALLSELESVGMVEQQADESAEARRRTIGRPPLQVSLAADAAYAVGLDFGHGHVRSAVCNLHGTIVADQWAPSDVDDHPVDSLDLAHRLTAAALDEAGIASQDVIGVGVGLAAPVDARHGAVHSDGILPGWDAIRPAQELERRLGLPVQISNDANAGAMGEHLFGAGRGVADMIYLRLSAGVGLGLVLGGQLYGGVSGIAGEVGHIPVVENGLICRCGNRGCLETVVSPIAVADLLARSRGEPVSIARLLELVELGDRGACRAIADAGEAVGSALAGAVNLLNPELVIIGGDLAAAGDVLLDPIRAVVDRRAVAPAANDVRVVRGALAEHAEVLGAAAIQLARAPEALASRLKS
jgi:predicted NBD/HSP70 family sugar kinase